MVAAGLLKKKLFVKYISGIPKSNNVFASQKCVNKRLIRKTTVYRNQGNWTISDPEHAQQSKDIWEYHYWRKCFDLAEDPDPIVLDDFKRAFLKGWTQIPC
jgi:hypothetical protein